MTSKQLKIILLSLVFGVLAAAPGASEADDSDLAQFRHGLDQILSNSCLREKKFGIEIYSLDREETVYAVRNTQPFIPASNLKLITTAAALHSLGPNYRFPTRLYTSGRVEGTTLFGDLYLKGFGDPKLVTEQMWLLVNKLRNVPVKKVVGDLVADDTHFDQRLKVKTWKRYRGARAYNAPLGALSFNFNTVTVLADPGPEPGDPVQVMVEPDTDYIRLNNKARTAPAGERGHLVIQRLDGDRQDQIVVSGSLPQNSPRQSYFVNITDPTLYTVHAFKTYLERAGIEVIGDVRTGTVPPNARLLLEHRSEPLALTLRGLNKFSNNFVAEQILKTLGAEVFGPPGTTRNGVKVLRRYLDTLSLDRNSYTLVDGSGLSPQNRLSPHQIVQVLRHVQKNLSIFPEFIAALGVMGVDGNVKRRMNGLDDAQRVRVKTGTLKGVSALSGFFQSKNKELFAFSILMNDLRCHNGKAWSIQDQIVREGLRFQRVDF